MPTEFLDSEIRPLTALGSTGLKQHGGMIDEEFLVRLRGRNAIRIYREMIHNSPVIASALYAIRMLIRQVKWRIEPSDESDAAKAEAEDTEGALEDMSHTFDDFISEVLSMIWAGYAPFEIVYKLRRGPDQDDGSLRSKFNDGKFGWRKIEIRGQETLDRWVFSEEDNGLDGMVQMDIHAHNHGPIFIPIEKMLLFRTDVFKGNPEGMSLLRPAAIPYWYIKRIQEFEAIGVERNLAGMPIMEVPAEILIGNASPEHLAARAALEKFITQVRMDERWGGLVPSEVKPDGSPSGYKFKLMAASGRKIVDTDIIIKRYRNEMLMLFMAQFLTMGTEKVGSFSLASNMTDLFATALGTIMGSITDVVNRFMIPRRQRLNGRPPELDPVLVHGDIEGPELDKLASYITSLSTTGVIGPNPALERKLLELANLPQPPEDEEVPAPLSEDTIDAVGRNSMSGEQVKVILDVNKALKNKQLDRASAIATLAAALGMSEEDAEKFIPEEVEPQPVPPGLMGGPPMPGNDEDEGDEDEGDEDE